MLVPVTLLPHRLGQYKIGAVQFSKTAKQRQVTGAGGVGSLEDRVQPAMEAVLASAQAKAMLQTEVRDWVGRAKGYSKPLTSLNLCWRWERGCRPCQRLRKARNP